MAKYQTEIANFFSVNNQSEIVVENISEIAPESGLENTPENALENNSSENDNVEMKENKLFLFCK